MRAKLAGGARARPNLDDLSWTRLNDYLRDATEDEARALLEAERAGQARPLVLNRIVCRYIKMHSQRLRQELTRPRR